MSCVVSCILAVFRSTMKSAASVSFSSDRKDAVPYLMCSKRTKTSEKGNFLICFSVPLSCPLVVFNRICAVWQLEVLINRAHVTPTRQQFEQVACTWLNVPRHISVLSKKIIDEFHPNQRMFNCFKGFDERGSHVWIVITPCSKFILVLKENSLVNISPLNEQSVSSTSFWWFYSLKGITV